MKALLQICNITLDAPFPCGKLPLGLAAFPAAAWQHEVKVL